MASNQFTAFGEKPFFESDEADLSVQEKIILEKQYNGYPKDTVGPTVNLFFHELTNKDSVSVQIFGKAVAGFLFIFFILLLPFIALAIKLSSAGPVLVQQTCTGFRGHLFRRYLFRTTLQNPGIQVGSDARDQTFFVGRMLKTSGLEELPSVLNILRGEMNLVGPKVRSSLLNNHWNNRFSEYYKRFAIKPGLIGVAGKNKVKDMKDVDNVRYTLRKELKYLLKPTLSKNFGILSRTFNIPLQRYAQRA